MNKKFFLILLLTLSVVVAFSETNGSLKNRVGRMPEEWDSLVGMVKKFEKNNNHEAYINLSNYMMGFAEAMYKDCEYLYDLYQGDYYKDWFSNQYNFYYEQYNVLKKYYGSKTLLFRYSYYKAGFDRVDKGSDRYSIYDF